MVTRPTDTYPLPFDIRAGLHQQPDAFKMSGRLCCLLLAALLMVQAARAKCPYSAGGGVDTATAGVRDVVLSRRALQAFDEKAVSELDIDAGELCS